MENTIQPVYDLVHRNVPWLTGHIEFEIISPLNGTADMFQLTSRREKVRVSATSKTALTAGLHHYLKYYCHRSASHCGNNLLPVYPIPLPEKKEQVSTPFQYRYALNYCTFNYTMPFWQWEKWEKELDWMALNGVNLMLVVTGIKAVWQKTLKAFGYTSKEIHRFIPGPGYNAWWLMGNLEGWGRLATQGLIDQQVFLTRRILQRMEELGITPIYHGFYGMVPRSMHRKFKEATIVRQGKWNGVFDRPDMLLCNSPLFREMAKVYYQKVNELYGNFHFFGGDPFHEGGNTQGMDVAAEAAAIHDAMQEAVPGSKWVLQAWQTNPKQELLNGIKNKEDLLILDIFGEVSREWEEREAFSGSPFVWCSINNFGEKTGLYGRLEKLASSPFKAWKSKYQPFMKGIGAIPEGIANNPVVFDLIFDSAWRPSRFKLQDWIKEYTVYRYGINDENLIQAWQYLLQTVYANGDEYREGAPESVFCARPSLQITSASTWGTRSFNYDIGLLEKAAVLFARASADTSLKDTYRFDLVDILRQVIANRGHLEYERLLEAYKNKRPKRFARHSETFLSLMHMQDDLLCTHSSFMLGKWLLEARDLRDIPIEKNICEWNARVLITYWGPDMANTPLHDYAHKEWGGMIRDFYLPRWKIFLDELQQRLDGKEEKEPDYYTFEKWWASQHNFYPSTPTDDPVKISRAILKKLKINQA